MDLDSKVLLKDNETYQITDEQELNAIIDYRVKNDKILISNISELRLVHKKTDETEEEFKNRVNAAIPIEEIKSHIEKGLFLDFNAEINGKVRHGVLPIRDIALNSIFERARCNCFTIANFEAAPDSRVLPLETKIKFLNDSFTLYGEVQKYYPRIEKSHPL